MNDFLQEISEKSAYVYLQDELWWLKGYLYKSSDYVSETEWRLITPLDGVAADSEPFSDISVKPKAIYYGVNIENDMFLKLEEIAKEKGLDRYRMIEKSSDMSIEPIKL